MLPSYRTMKYKSPIWGYFHVQKVVLNLRTFEYGVRMLINVKVQKDIKGERKKRNRILTNTAKPARRLRSFLYLI